MAIAILTLLPAVVTFDAFWPHNFLTLRPTYTITDWQLARPIMEEYLESTSKGTWGHVLRMECVWR